ncbi:MAG: hypothetical protein LH609_09875 [Rudanella sp.]|nr:hypothetical protein [Rudanella sp.]
MNRYILLIGSLLLSGTLQAQSPYGRSSVRLGADLTSLDAPDAVGTRYMGRLARHFKNDRIVVAAEAGYLYISTLTQLFNGIDPGPNRRERFTADATVFYDFLRHPRHALRLGVGVSAWYRRENTYRGARILSSPSSTGGVAIDRQQLHGLNTGGHLATEYEWLFNSRWGLDVRLRVANLKGAGISSMLGGGISHRF